MMFRNLTVAGLLLALPLIALTAFAHLSGGGSPCPDWPACFGQFIVTNLADFSARAAVNFPEQAINAISAIAELGSRYLSFILVFLAFILTVSAFRQSYRTTAVSCSLGILVLAGLQIGVNYLLSATPSEPINVAGSLSLAMLGFWLWYWLYLRSQVKELPVISGTDRPFRVFVWLVLVILCAHTIGFNWLDAVYAKGEYQTLPGFLAEWQLLGDFGNISFDAATLRHGLTVASTGLSLALLAVLAFLTGAERYPFAIKVAGVGAFLLLLTRVGLGIFELPEWVAPLQSAILSLSLLPVIAIHFYNYYGFQPLAESPATPALKPEPQIVPAEIEEAADYIGPEPENLYLRLKAQLKKTRSGLGGLLGNLALGQKEINADLFEDIETSLLTADIGINLTTEIISQLTQSLERNQLNDSKALSAALKESLLAVLRPCSQPLQIPKQDKPFVILVVGVNGAGKTTTIGKLAKRLQAQGHSVMLAAGDTFRAAAVEQLQTWGERNHIHVVAQHTGADSASVIFDGVQSAQAKGIDVLIADTAGRLHTKSNLMEELKKITRIMTKIVPDAPHEVLLVLDAGTGQNALSQAKLFNETVPLTGLVLTKLDGTAKGGVIFPLCRQLGVPVRFIGIGEGIDDLQDFNAENFVDALFVKD